MTYKELIQEVWNLHIKPQDDRKKYTIKNSQYVVIENIENTENDIECETFGVGLYREGGWFEIIGFDYQMRYKMDDIGDLVIFAYSDTNTPMPLCHCMIESENWELIEVKDKDKDKK